MTRRRVHIKQRSDEDDGVLILAVVLTLVFGILAAALASYGAVSFRFHRVVRQQSYLRASAEGGLRYGLEKLRLHQTLCADVAGSLADQSISYPGTINGATVTISCRYAGGNLPAANEWGVILTGIGVTSAEPSFQAAGSSSVYRTIDGPVFMQVSSPASIADGIDAPVKLNEGDLWYYGSTCATATAPTMLEMTIAPSPPRGKQCTTHSWQDIAPMPPLPTKPLPVDPSGRDDLVSGCRVFFPGAYAAPPSLGSDNYFISGDYYFDFNDDIDISKADVLGGQPSPYSDDVIQMSDLAPSCADVTSNTFVAAAETGYGVTWILGGDARIDIGTHGRMELFSRAQSEQDVSIQAVEVTGSGFYASTHTVSSGAIISMKEGNTNDMVVHGLIRAPYGLVEFGNVTNTASAQAVGGVVVAAIDLQGSASASGWVLGRSNRPSATKVALTAVATSSDGVKVTMKTVADFRLGRTLFDGVSTSGSATFTSATAAFTSADVGSAIVSTVVPSGTKIASVTNSTTVVLSANASVTRSGLQFTVRTAEVAINSWRRV